MRLEQLIEGNDSVQQHVASEREKTALEAVSPMARRAIKQEILPQIEENVVSVEAVGELGKSTKSSIEAAFSSKNQLYTRLIGYKSIDQSDDQYLEDLLVVMDEWMRSTESTLADDPEEKVESASPEPQKVEITVKMESEPLKLEMESDPLQIELKAPPVEAPVVKDTSSGEEIPQSLAEIFDLADVRL